MKFLWTTINVSDMDSSLEFYRNILGLPLNRRFSPAPGMDIAFLGEGETQVELICNSSADSPIHSLSVAMGFKTDSVELKIEELQSKGISLHEGPYQPSPGIRFFYILDPDGVKIQFVEENS